MIIDNGSSCVYCFFLQKINVSFIMAFFFLVTWNISFVTEWVSGLVKSNIQYVIRLWITFNSNVSSKRNSPSPTRNHIVIGFYFNQVVMRVHGIEQLWECIKNFISSYESVLLPLATRWEKTMASGETKAEKGKRWEAGGGIFRQKAFQPHHDAQVNLSTRQC